MISSLHTAGCVGARSCTFRPRARLPSLGNRFLIHSQQRESEVRIRHSSSSTGNSHTKASSYPVIIVGGGPTGLFLARLLQRYGVDFCLLEGQPLDQHFQHPQAHFLNTRTMEILKHYDPSLFHKVVRAMPPVEEWNRFIFGPNMTASSMAIVQHPVHAPLVAQSDANGVLLEPNQDNRTFAADSTTAIPLSDCSVGHLAQHTFHRILYQQVQQNMPMTSSLQFGSRVEQASRSPESHWTLTTQSGEVFQTPVVVAADGAKSIWRQNLAQVSMTGQPTIQHLINVHFSVHDAKHPIPPAMLYTVFSSQVLAMVVRHGPADYVMQIPYFPPYQSIDHDFSMVKVQEMVQAALGTQLVNFQVRSIRPWTMGSLVAETYARNNVYLVGDAAHVFPPAGGFGMNTGLQDALALAWRIKYFTQGTISDPGSIYTTERQAVAHQNAALSVRNYQRVLGVMKTCYLDERNLPILLKTLQAATQMGVPLPWQKATFQKLFQTALLPLRMLQEAPHSLYSKHITNNLQRLLQLGQGLPLLFPNHEVAFSYPTPEQQAKQDDSLPLDWSRDSTAGVPELLTGRLFPHLPCQWISRRSNNSGNIQNEDATSETTTTTTTRDLSTQLATKNRPCSFCLLGISSTASIGSSMGDLVVDEIAALLEQDLGSVTVDAAQLWIGPTPPALGKAKNSAILLASEVEWQQRERLSSTWCLDLPIFVLIRPDGHVAAIIRHDQRPQMLHELVRAARHALGISLDS